MAEKLLFFLHRPPGLERDEFLRRYLNGHAPLVLRHCPRMRRYVINLLDGPSEKTVDFGPGKGPLAVDAVLELQFDAMDDFADRSRRYDSPEGRSVVETSAHALVGASAGYRVAEHIQRDYERTWPDGERSPGMKVLSALHRAAGLSHEQFAERWVTTHAPLALRHVLGMSRYVTNVVLEPLTPGAPEVDGIVEVQYAEKRRFDSPEGERALMEDTQALLQPPQRLRAGEYIIRS